MADKIQVAPEACRGGTEKLNPDLFRQELRELTNRGPFCCAIPQLATVFVLEWCRDQRLRREIPARMECGKTPRLN